MKTRIGSEINSLLQYLCLASILITRLPATKSLNKNIQINTLSSLGHGRKSVPGRASILCNIMPKPSKRKRENRLTLKNSETDSPEIKNDTKEVLLTQAWLSHDAVSFHEFGDKEACDIRNALLVWYRQHRRKLPWRGDPPPYNGSTAVKTKKEKLDIKTQPRIHAYFQSKQNEIIDATLQKSVKEEENVEAFQVVVSGYTVWVSEIMLQQTRVEAVIPYYIKWMESFPTVYDLACATEEEVNSHWSGLGFYRRARMLHSGAKLVVEKYDGKVPCTVEELLNLPGVGKYTASAIASIAYNVSTPVVDGNVCRVLSRLKAIANHIKAPVFKDRIGWHLAGQIVTADGGDHAGEVNQALMELGATWCAPSGTGLAVGDPLRDYYYSTKIGKVLGSNRTKDMERFVSTMMENKKNHKQCKLCDSAGISKILAITTDHLNNYSSPTSKTSEVLCHAGFPIPPPKKTKREEVLAVVVLRHQNKLLMIKRPKNGLLSGQWEFPSVCLWDSVSGDMKAKNKNDVIPFIDKIKRKKALDSFLRKLIPDLATVKRKNVRDNVGHVFSHVRHNMWIEYADVEQNFLGASNIQNKTYEGRDFKWMSEENMKVVGLTSGVKKIIAGVQSEKQK